MLPYKPNQTEEHKTTIDFTPILQARLAERFPHVWRNSELGVAWIVMPLGLSCPSVGVTGQLSDLFSSRRVAPACSHGARKGPGETAEHAKASEAQA